MSLVSLESIAARIVREHEAALASAESAIGHARTAGKLLLEARERCEGKWLEWLSANCSQIAERTAQKYMQIARHPALEASSIGEALLKLASPRQPNNPPGRAGPQDTEPAKKTAGESQNSLPPQPIEPQPPQFPPEREPEMPAAEALGEADGSAPEPHEAEQLAAALQEQDASVERVLGGAGAEELKRQAAEIASLKVARDGFMNGKAAVEKLLAAEQRKVKGLARRVAELESENEALRERIAVTQESRDAA